MKAPYAAFACLLAAILPGCNGSPPFDPSKALYHDISGEKALEQVAALVAFGPRPAGSKAIENSRQYIEDQLKQSGWTVTRQTFEVKTSRGTKSFSNLIARFGSTSDPATILLCSHYDTKESGSFEFVGANDGGSSTGLLIEMGRVLATRPAVAQKVKLVFFDGEEAFGTRINRNDGLYGSRHYAKELLLVPEKNRPRWGVLLDMVGDRNLNIRAAWEVPGPDLSSRPDPESVPNFEFVKESLRNMSKWLLSSASELGHRSEVGIGNSYIIDDHVPLNVSAGVPTINLIDFDYDYWHTPGDTLDKISAESLEITGKVTMLLLEKHLLQN